MWYYFVLEGVTLLKAVASSVSDRFELLQELKELNENTKKTVKNTQGPITPDIKENESVTPDKKNEIKIVPEEKRKQRLELHRKL